MPLNNQYGLSLCEQRFPELAPHIYGRSHHTSAADPTSHTLQPILTGTSVVAIKYRDGVMMAADTQASYGSLARYSDVSRIFVISGNTLVGISGEISDMQQIKRNLDMTVSLNSHPVVHQPYNAKNIHRYLSRYMYSRRCQFDPLLNSVVVCGHTAEGSYLGYVDYLGVTYESSAVATGMGSYIAFPILRKAVDGREDALTQEEAVEVLLNCMRVLYCSDSRASNKVQLAISTKEGSTISMPQIVPTDWSVASRVTGY